MKKITILLLFSSVFCFAQTIKQKPVVDLSKILISIDSISYQSLFENSFVKDTLFICEENIDGKLFIGKGSTIEFAHPNSTTNSEAKFGDLAITFKTRKLEALNRIKSDIKAPHSTDTAFTTGDKTKIAYRELALTENPSKGKFAVSLVEYQKTYLQSLGFSDEQIASEMSFETFNSVLSGGKDLTRNFLSIKAMELELSSAEFDYLQQSILSFGGSKSGKILTLNKVDIHCKIVQNDGFRLKSVFIALLGEVPDREINISKNIQLTSHGNIAEIRFKYQ